MVKSVTGLSGSGIKDWVLQRLSAVILGVYVIFLTAYVLSHSPLDYATWQGLFAHSAMKIFSLLAVISLIAHAWVGMWTIFTDYVTCAYARGTLQVLMVLAFFVCLVWSIQILWS